MERSVDASRAKPKSKIGDYAKTVFVVLSVCFMLAASVWRGFHARQYENPRSPIGFSREWRCEGAGLKGGGFCIRDVPPPPRKQPAP